MIKIYDTRSAISFEAAKKWNACDWSHISKKKKTSKVVIVQWLGNFATRVEQDGTLKMDFRVELHSQEAKRRQREIP